MKTRKWSAHRTAHGEWYYARTNTLLGGILMKAETAFPLLVVAGLAYAALIVASTLYAQLAPLFNILGGH